MNETRLRRTLPDQSSGSGYTIDTSHHTSVTNTILSKRVCFYKSGDPQFNGLRVVINSRTFKTFDALLDSLSKKVPLPFGVRNITTPRGVHGISTLDELEDGKSYICSDSRRVKPIDLALARRKLPPWYHARPVSSRRRTAKFFPGRRNIHREDPVAFRTPKKLVVFRNGDPSARYTVLLRKKTTPSYESILGHISELMQFHVSKLHTPEGQRIDGLPGLILCSGSVVAVGREPFRPVEYSAEKPASPTRRRTKQRAFKRQKASVSKKMTPSFSSKSRNFSASSERYIVHQIHNSIAESSCDLPSNATNSIQSDSDRILESLAETEEDTCLGNGGNGGQDGALSNDDNIEKSFRVNQDGSMTVEMKVRLTIKEEETVQWTTTLTRSVVSDQLNVACLPDSDPDQVCLKSSQTSAASTDIIHKDRTRDDNDDEPPSLGNGAFSDSFQEEDDLKEHAEGVPLRRAPTPGRKKISKLQASVDSFDPVTVDEFGEENVGSYFFREETENRTTEQFYMENQKSTRPVPKPRRLGSVDASSAFKSTEIMQTESSREEVTETVVHIYEQQTCHDNFLANVGVHCMSASGATSETRQLCSSNELDHDLWRPSLAFEPVSKWRTDSMSVTSDLHLASLKAGAIQGAKREQLQQSTKSHVKPGEKEQSVSSRPRKHVRLVMTAGKRRKKASVKDTEKRKRVKPFSSAVFIKRIYGNKAKPPKKMKKIKKRATPTRNSLPKPNAKNVNVQLSLKEKMSEQKADTSHPQRELTWQSLHNKDRPLQPFNPSSSVAKEYVKNWLENACSNPPSNQDKERKKAEGLTPVQTQKKVVQFSEETPATSKTLELSSPENVVAPSVKLRVQSFEHKSTPAVEKTTVRPKNANNYTANANVENYNRLSQTNAQAKPFLNGICTNESNEDRNITTPTSSVSMELPPPPPELLNAEDFANDAASATSSPMSSQKSDNSQVRLSPTSDKAISPEDNTMEKTTSAQSKNTLAELSRAPSIKRAPLVSNRSLESKMSPRKATLDKYGSDNEATEEETPLPAPISSVGEEVCLTRTTQQVKATSEETQQPILELGTLSFCTSVSPLSLTSDERMSPSSVVSSETSVLGKTPIQETKMAKTPQIEKKSPKSLMKRAKLKSSPSPERKFHKRSSDSPNLSPMTGRLLDKHVLSNKGLQKPETPNASPSTERKHHETTELQRTSPYSQSLDVVSPPGRHKSSKKLLPRNLSLDSPSELKNGKPKKTSSQRESHQTTQTDADNGEEAKATKIISAMPESTNPANQPNMKPVLEKICYSIKSIRQITQNKRPSCLEKSNSLPDFSSHVASTFGSSSKVLLAFLAVMTLKDGLTNLNVKELNANNVSCAEALKMIDSLREIANIEDSQRLRTSLSDLQQSASMQLLQSWRGFQELGDRCKSRNATPNDLEAGLGTGAGPELGCGIGGNVIDEIIDNLDIPQKLKEELVSLTEDAENERNNGGNVHYGQLKLLADQNSHANTKNVYTEDCVAQGDKHNVDVRSIAKKITNINHPEQLEGDRTPLLSEAGKYKPTGRSTEDNGCKDWSNNVADSKNNPQEKQIYSTASLNLQSCRDVAHDDNLENEKQHQQAYLSVKLTQERANINGDVCSETKPVKQELYMDCSQLTRNEKNINVKSDLDEESPMFSSVSKDCCKQDPEKRAEVTHQEIKPEINASFKLGSLSVEKRPNSNYNVEVNVTGKKTIFTPVSENLQAEFKSTLLQSQMCSMRLNKSTDNSTGSSDVEEPSSEDEQPEVDCKKLQIIIEESLSGNEEEEEEPFHDPPKCAEQTKKGRELEALREEPEEDQVSSEDEVQYADKRKQQSSPERGLIGLLENPDLHIKKEDSSLIISESLGKVFRFNVDDDDSGNDHSSFEEHVDEVQLNDEDKQMSSLIEEELSYYEKDFSSEEEQACKERKIKEGHVQNQETPPRAQLEESNHETIVQSPKQKSDEVMTQSVAERVTLLEQQVAEAQKPKLAPKSSPIRRFSQRKSPPESEDPPSELPLCTRSAPQSSLSFSYDSSGVITTEPEGSRVRSIREMFLARSATDIQQRGFLSSNSSELRAETSDSGGYQTQTSSDLSGSEDVSARKSISKGFVKRAIEMLYGKKDLEPKEASDRSPSDPDQRKREPLSIFSPFHTARSKAMSELSYFNSSNALDIFSEATRCVAFNAQVGPGDSVPIDNGRWLLRENTSMRKSVSDPVGINKTFTNTFHDDGLCKDTEEKTPYSLFSTKPEVEDDTKSQPGKCTYFSLPYASESEVCQDEMGTLSVSSKNEDSAEETKDASDDSKTWAERNGTLPRTGVADFKMKGNKVHPLVELPLDGEVVVVQPGKGQGVVSRRIQEPDVLDLLYNFCGEHCPIL